MRMRRALAEYHVGGIRTNLRFSPAGAAAPRVRAGAYDTGFIERYKAELAPCPRRPGDRRLGGAGGGSWRRGRRAPSGGRRRVPHWTPPPSSPRRGGGSISGPASHSPHL